MAYLGVAVATLSRGIVDSAVNSDVGGIVYFAIILISLTIAQLVIRIISKVLTFNVSSKLEISIKQDIFDNIIRKNIMRFQAYTPANCMNNKRCVGFSQFDYFYSAEYGVFYRKIGWCFCCTVCY